MSKNPILLLGIILIITFIAFIPSLRNGFMYTWDDDKYVVNNPVIKELNGSNLGKMFTRPVNGTYVPLPLITFAVEQKLFGDKPFPRHVTNLLLHLLCTALVFQIFRMLKINPLYAAFGALLFGIHPMRVESVAWITERKDVLYGFFYLAAIFFYIRHISNPGKGSNNKVLTYLFFLLALFSKIEAVTLPLSLLLIDYFSNRPLKFKLILEKIPMFILSLLFGLAGIYIIYRVGLKTEGFLAGNISISFIDRIFYAFYSISIYLVKLLAPFSLSAWYPYPQFTGYYKILFYLINPLILTTLAFFIYRYRDQARAVVFGSLFFLVNVIFLLQIFAVGIAWSADRFTYIPYIGLFFIIAWLADTLVKQNKKRQSTVITFLSLFSLMCLFLTNERCKDWYNGETLWSNVIIRYPETAALPYVNRGVSYTMAAKWPEALNDFNKALGIDKDCKSVYNDRAIVYGNMGRHEEAIADFSEAIKTEPGNANRWFNRGVSYVNSGKPEEAIPDFLKAAEINPTYLSAYINLAMLYFQAMKYDTSFEFCMKGLKINSSAPELNKIAGDCMFEQGDESKAAEFYRSCLMGDDVNLDAILGMALIMYNRNEKAAAEGYLQRAKQVNPGLTLGMQGVDEMVDKGWTISSRKKLALSKLLMAN